MNNKFSHNVSCDMNLILTNWYDLALNINRVSLFILLLLWVLIATRTKEFHNKNFIFLYNLNFTTLFYVIWGLTFLFSTNCPTQSEAMCIYQVVANFYSVYLPGFSLSVFALHRLACAYYLDIRKRLTWRIISYILGLVWLTPGVLTVFHLYALKNQIYYNSIMNQCLVSSELFFPNAVLASVFGLLGPSFVIFFAYISLLIKIRNTRKAVNSSQRIEAPRLTVQIIIYIILFELSNVASIYQSLINVFFLLKPSDTVLKILRILKWFQYYCPIGLLYFHPIMLKKYEAIGMRIKKYFQWRVSLKFNKEILYYFKYICWFFIYLMKYVLVFFVLNT